MSNRKFKLEAWNKNPNCHWCQQPTILTNVKLFKGQPDPRMATVDHLISRFNPERYLKKNSNPSPKVLACFECNQRRSYEEAARMSEEELKLRNAGFSFKPKGYHGLFESVEQVISYLKEKGIDIPKMYDSLTICDTSNQLSTPSSGT